ncbi:MAG: B12-binding domain-containing radical SAM protein [Deltaproteobacteria bacterium]|nr:B12-binding domain-containing radical SAM protein [Deltaproteobacteria bacterium]
MADVFVLNPPVVQDFCRSARWAARSRGRVQRHPDWLLTAVAVLEEAGFTVDFLDGPVLNLELQEVLSALKKSRPNLVVLHTTTPSIDSDLSYASLAKELLPDCQTVAVGPHVTAEPDDTLKRANGTLDVVIRGEYDYTLRELAQLASSGWAIWKLSEIEGISYLDQANKLVHTSSRPYLEVNSLPFPSWQHIDPKWYRDAGKRFPFITLISGRGCFGRCTFCRDVPLMEGKKLRMRDPTLVVDEIEYDFSLFPYLREVMFETDTFTASPKHVEGVCKEILERNLKVTWSCNCRTDVDLKLLPLMKRAGCRMLMVGFEFGTQEALDAVRKGTTLEQSVRLAKEAERLGFTVHGCFMFGAPGENMESALKTIEFAKSLPMDTVQFSGICAYPGTEIYQQARQNGSLVPETWREWVDENWEQVTVLDYPGLNKEEIDQLIDRGLREFYLRPSQMIRMAIGIRTQDDLRRKLYGFKMFIQG